MVPNGYRVLNVILDCDPLDVNASPTLTGTAGDGGERGTLHHGDGGAAQDGRGVAE